MIDTAFADERTAFDRDWLERIFRDLQQNDLAVKE